MRSSEIIDNGQKLDLDHHGYSGVLRRVATPNFPNRRRRNSPTVPNAYDHDTGSKRLVDCVAAAFGDGRATWPQYPRNYTYAWRLSDRLVVVR